MVSYGSTLRQNFSINLTTYSKSGLDDSIRVVTIQFCVRTIDTLIGIKPGSFITVFVSIVYDNKTFSDTTILIETSTILSYCCPTFSQQKKCTYFFAVSQQFNTKNDILQYFIRLSARLYSHLERKNVAATSK